MNQLKYLDLCAGTGAFSLVMKKINAKCILSNDMEKNSQIIYNINFPDNNFILDDINIAYTKNMIPNTININDCYVKSDKFLLIKHNSTFQLPEDIIILIQNFK